MTARTNTSDLATAIDAVVQAAVDRQRLPGLSIIVARGDDIIVARGYGRRNVGESLAADTATTYSIASISKQFTVAAIMQLAERGRLRIDDRIKRYFPWLACDDSVELRHLLSHTSGIRDYFPLDDLDRIGFVSATPREIAERATVNGPAFAPGAEYQYSNTGYVLLGALLEAVAQMPYAEYLARHLFEPLGLARTGVDDTPAIRSNVAVGYTSFALGPWELARDYHPSWEFATGGLYSCASDMLAWNRALRGGRVVRPESFAAMTTAARLTNGHELNYGLGLALNEIGGLHEVRHTGGLPGISTDNATYPAHEIDIIVFVNHDGCSTYATIARPILALLLDDPALRGARPADPRASSGLTPRPEADRWLRAAAAGSLAGVPLTAKFERFLQTKGPAPFAALPALGEIRSIRPIDANRRDPETTFSYSVEFETTTLAGILTIRDDGKLAGITFVPWDDRG